MQGRESSDSSRPPRPESLPFGLSFVDGRGVLTLAGRRAPGPVTIDLLEMEIPGLRFPFDLSAGLGTFRHRRCSLLQTSLSLATPEAQRWLAVRVGRAEFGYRNLALCFARGGVELCCQVALGTELVDLLLRGFVRPSGATAASRAVELCLVDLRCYGPSSVPAPLLAAGLLRAAGAGRERDARAQLVGCCDAALDPLALTLLYTLPVVGWRLPRATGVRLSWIAIEANRLQLVYRSGGDGDAARGHAPVAGLAPERVQRFLAVQEAKCSFRSLEETILDAGPRAALELYRRQLLGAHSTAHPFVLERLLQLAAVEPGAEAEALELCARARAIDADSIDAELAEATVRWRRGDAAVAADCYRRASAIAARRGDRVEEALAALAAARAALAVDRQAARADFEHVLAIDGDNEAALAQLAPLYAEATEWRHLVEVRHRQLAHAASDDARLHSHLALGELHRVHLADPQRAREHYEQAIALDPSCEPALRGLAEACIDSDDLISALRALDLLCTILAERLDVDEEVAVHLRIASLWEHMGDTPSALARLDRARKLRPAHPQALQRAAVLLSGAGKLAEAAALLRLLAQLPDAALRLDAHRRLAEICLAADDLDGASAESDAALGLDSEDAATLKLALAIAERGRNDARIVDALERLARLERSPVARAALHLRRGQVLAALPGRNGEALAALERAAEGAQDEGHTAHSELARLLATTGELERARSAWERALRTPCGDRDPTTWAALASVCLELVDLERAHAAAERAFQIAEPGSEPQRAALRSLVRVARAAGEREELCRRLEQLCPFLDPEQPEGRDELAACYAELAETREQLGDPAAAAATYQRALALRPDDLRLRERLGLALEAVESWAEARAEFEQISAALGAEPASASRRAALALRVGTLAERQAHPREAIDAYRRALADGLPIAEADFAWDRIVELHLDRGDPDAAARAAQAAAEQADGDGDRGERCARRLHQAGELWLKRAGQRQPAIECFRAALARRPHHRGALDALESILAEVGDREALAEILAIKAELACRRPAIQKALLCRLGETLEAIGRRDAARSAYSSALSLDGDYLPALDFLARDCLATGELERAEIYLRRLLASIAQPYAELGHSERGELQVDTHLRLAELARRRQQLPEQEGHLELALSLDPHNALALEALDDLLAQQRRPLEQLEIVRRRVEAAPDLESLVVLELRRAALLESLPARRDEAIAVYRQLLLLAPTQEAALERLSALLRDTGRLAELGDVLEHRAEIEETRAPATAVRLLVDAARALRDEQPGRAASLLRRALRSAPDDATALAELVSLRAAGGDPGEVDELLTRLAAVTDDAAERAALEAQLAELRVERGAREAARDLLARAACEGRASRPMLARLATLQATLGEHREAAETWGRVARDARESQHRAAELDACRGLLALAPSLGGARVEEVCSRLLELDPSDRVAARQLVGAIEEREDWPAAVQALRALLALERAALVPGSEELATLTQLALALDRSGDSTEAARLLREQALPLARRINDPAPIATLVDAARGLGLESVELACLRLIVAGDSDAGTSARRQLRISVLCSRIGDPAAATAALLRAVEILPRGPERAAAARQLLASLGDDDERLEGPALDAAQAALASLHDADASPVELARLARLAARRGDREQALAVLDELPPEMRRGPDERELRWGLLEELGHGERLCAELEACARESAGEEAARMLYRRAALLVAAGRPADEIEAAHRAVLARAPDHPQATAGLRQLLAERGDTERLAALLVERAAASPDLEAQAEALRRGARQLRELRDLERALALVRRARELRPEDAQLVALSADLCQELGRLDDAEHELALLADLGSAAEALERAAALARLRGDPAAEARHLSRMLRGDRLERVLPRLAAAYQAAGDLVGLRAVLEEHATEPGALLELARLCAGPLGDRAAALDAYRRYLEHDASHRESLEAALAISRELGDQAGMLPYLLRLRALQPPGQRRLELAREAATIAEELGRRDYADAAWRAALEDAPSDTTIVERVADALARQGAWRAMCQLLEHALAGEIDGESRARLALVLGETYLDRLGEEQPARSWLAAACRSAPGGERAFRRLLDLHLARHEHLEASELCAQRVAHAAESERAPLWLELGRLREGLADLAGAAQAYAAACRAQPQLDLGLAERAQELYLRVGDLASALAIVDHAISRADEDVHGRLLALKARALALSGQLNEAISCYARALERDPELHAARAALGRLLFERGMFEAALPHLERAGESIAQTTEGASCAFLAARALEKLGRVDDALAGYQRAMARDPRARAAIEALLPALEERGASEQLAAALATLVAHAGEPRASLPQLARLAVVQRRLGKTAEAEASWRATLAVEPGHAEALAALRHIAGERGDWRECAALIERELEQTADPARHAQLERELGQLCAGPLGDRERAIRHLRAALDHDASDTLAAGVLLSLLEAAGQPAEAARLAHTYALRVDDASTRRELLIQAAAGYEAAGQEADAQVIYRELRQSGAVPEVRSTAVPSARLVENGTAPPRATRGYELAGEEDGWATAQTYRLRATNPALPLHERAELLIAAARTFEEKLSRSLEAMGLFEEAALLAPDYLPAVEALADAAYRNQDWHRARDLYDRLWQDDEHRARAEICYRRGLVYETLGDDATADLCYAHTVALSPAHRPAHEGRARLALFRDDERVALESLAALERLVSVEEIEVRAGIRQQLGKLHLRAGNLTAARESLEGALALDSKRVKAMQTLLTVLQAQRDFAAMLDALQKLLCVSNDPLVRASLLHHRAEILGAELGDEAAAVDNLLKAYDLAPDYPPTLWRLIDYYWEQGDLPSVAEMGEHLVMATEVERESPDLRHVRLAIAFQLTHGRENAAGLLRHALAREELLDAALVDLGRAAASGGSGELLAQLLRSADPEGRAVRRLRELAGETPGLGELTGALGDDPARGPVTP